MPITRIQTVYNNLERVYWHHIDSAKTTYQGSTLIGGINCNASSGIAEMKETKVKFGKTNKVLGYTGYISFSKTECATPRLAFKLAGAILSEMWGSDFQVVYALHVNTEYLHVHFLVNSVAFTDGHKAVNGEKNYCRLRAISDKWCNELVNYMYTHRSAI